MKNVTIALDDEIHRQARIRAAELGTSLSALVKDYLKALVDGAAAGPAASGVREMQASFQGFPVEAPIVSSASREPPYRVDGKKVWTKDGKPRRPGAMRGLGGWTEDFDTWPDGFLDALYGDDSEAADQWWRSANDRLSDPGQ
jgi:plasmid stability protein